MTDHDSAPTILVADDEEDVRELVSYRLTRSGYRMIGAGDGQEALDLAAERIPDLMVLDVTMPKLDGYELTRRVRAEAALRSIPIILLTARSQESDVDHGFEAGADDLPPQAVQSRRTRGAGAGGAGTALGLGVRSRRAPDGGRRRDRRGPRCRSSA